MKVLHVITGLGVGGAEQQLRLLLRHLPAPYTAEVVTLTNPGAVADGLRADGVPVTHLGMGGNRDLGALPRLARLVRRGRYDLVHTHLYRACVYGRIAARLAGVPSVATEHSLGEAEIEGRPLSRGNRALYLATERLGAATVAVSPTVAGRLRAWGVPGQRVHVVPNGVDAARFAFDPAARRAVRARLGLAEDVFVVGGVGRLVPGKRFDLLVDAVAALPRAVLLLAGDGPEREALRARAVRLGAAGRVRLLGERADVPGLLSAVDAFVSASREEAFGLAVVEALAAGLPVLHGACPAVDDLPAGLAPGATALRGTGVRELVDALRSLAGDRPRLPPPGAVVHYDIARTARLLTDVYARAAPRVPGHAAHAVPPTNPTTVPPEEAVRP
ncbi:glycosyltransferase [Streptomyces genisteinicus]|uniref:D-inositol 3-phosphate glycosyltransferase n=1 Tax=Streptomyces genisteinicus TaxID=2768068 RepID=A0A7H0HWU0_9ACTN|nr:glycosyltransferase [Streptomyces genisteinicus]QNP65006.1 glycosyltransferase [Streptomyces genisteinicus]